MKADPDWARSRSLFFILDPKGSVELEGVLVIEFQIRVLHTTHPRKANHRKRTDQQSRERYSLTHCASDALQLPCPLEGCVFARGQSHRRGWRSIRLTEFECRRSGAKTCCRLRRRPAVASYSAVRNSSVKIERVSETDGTQLKILGQPPVKSIS